MAALVKALNQLAGKINIGTLTCMKSGYVRAQIDGDKLLLFCDDDITAGLLKAEPTKTRVQTAASELEAVS